MRLTALVALALLPALAIAEPIKRDHKQRAAFQRMTPCPATGKTRGPCPGYVIDHRKPLCAGGPDLASNMAWQTTAEAKRKDRAERAECRAIRRGKV